MDFSNIWQQCIPEHNGVSDVYPGSYAQGHGHEIGLSIYVTIKAASEGISLVLTSLSCLALTLSTLEPSIAVHFCKQCRSR